MSFILRCYTLFDITFTGVSNRNIKDQTIEWNHKRNTQCNFDTVLQVISLRSQPEVVSYPVFSHTRLNKKFNFGTEYVNKLVYTVWQFDFEIMHTAVFQDSESELGLLHDDCNNVPMIQCHTMNKNIYQFLDTSKKYRNIYFEVLKNEL